MTHQLPAVPQGLRATRHQPRPAALLSSCPWSLPGVSAPQSWVHPFPSPSLPVTPPGPPGLSQRIHCPPLKTPALSCGPQGLTLSHYLHRRPEGRALCLFLQYPLPTSAFLSPRPPPCGPWPQSPSIPTSSSPRTGPWSLPEPASSLPLETSGLSPHLPACPTPTRASLLPHRSPLAYSSIPGALAPPPRVQDTLSRPGIGRCCPVPGGLDPARPQACRPSRGSEWESGTLGTCMSHARVS